MKRCKHDRKPFGTITAKYDFVIAVSDHCTKCDKLWDVTKVWKKKNGDFLSPVRSSAELRANKTL